MNRRGTRAAIGIVAFVGLGSAGATAQPFDVERPLVLVVGAPSSGVRMACGNAHRTGLATSLLPGSRLHTEWRTSLGFVAQQGPLVDAQGRTYVVGDSGEVVVLARDGTVASHVVTRGPQPGPAALLSDDTLVFADGAGDAMAVRDGAVRWRSRFGRASTAHAAPLALDDGGVVVTSGPDLAILDAGGQERARTVLAEPTSHPLVSALGRIIVVSDTGTVWAWVPGALEAERLASFGSDIDGSAALFDAHTLVAVAGAQTNIVAVDLSRRSTSKLSGPLGGLWLGSPAVAHGVIYATQITPAGEAAVALDASGAERGRALVSGLIGGAALDAGGLTTGGGRTPPVVDGTGRLAFATLSGSMGVVADLSASTSSSPGQEAPVELVADVCPPSPGGHSRAEPVVVGIAPLAPAGVVAVCRSGIVVAMAQGLPSGGAGAPRL
jgi:hypothetical protein